MMLLYILNIDLIILIILERYLNDVENLEYPKKTIFVVSEGILLGCVVSKHEIMIDPKRTQAISKITYPSSKKSMQSFLGKIIFVRRFITNFSEIIRPL